MMRHAKRADNNQAEIVAALRGAGWEVLDMHKAGQGVFDLLARKGSVKVWVECKAPGAKMTDAERTFAQFAPGPIAVVYGPEDAITTLAAIWMS